MRAFDTTLEARQTGPVGVVQKCDTQVKTERAAAVAPNAVCGLVRQMLMLRPHPAFVASERGVVVVANTAAQNVMSGSFDWTAGNDGDTRCRNVQLLAMLGQLASGRDADKERIARMTVWADGRPTLTVVSKLSGPEPTGAAAPCQAGYPSPGQLMLVCLRDGKNRQIASDPSLLIDAFDFSPTEARIALALLEQQTLRDIAAATGVKISTVRWHLRNILAKSGRASQVDLIRLLASVYYM